ncbi:Colicin V production protein [Lachnospiraceae bacterium XBB1006]|nr:Colicin V production protein [Lachnospiraceae bacterium XBB1006]
MNWLSVGVLIGAGIFIIRGYRIGFVKVAYSLVAMLISLALVSAVTPYVKKALMENTTVYEKLTEKCSNAVEDRIGSKDKELSLPFAVKAITGALTHNDVEKKISQKTGETVAMWILCVMAFLGSFVIVGLLVNFIGGALDIVTKLPVIHGINQLLGAVAGALEALLIIWILGMLVTAFCLEESCYPIFSMIKENQLLSFLYENNGIIYLVSYFML